MFAAIRDWLVELAGSIAALLRNFFEDFKRSGKAFRLKAGLVGGYLAIGVATLVVFPPPGELNQIGAEVRISRTVIVGGRYFLVVNRSDSAWKDITLVLNGSYRAGLEKLVPGKKRAVFFHQFQDAAGKPPAENIIPMRLRIDCSAGAFERDYRRYREN